MSGTDKIKVKTIAPASCGPVVPVIQGTPTYNQHSGQIQLPIALKNEGTTVYRPPVSLVVWPDSVEPKVFFPSSDGVDWGKGTGIGWIWYCNSVLAPSPAMLQRLDPGTTSRPRTVELRVGSTVTRLRIRVRAHARQIDTNGLATAPESTVDVWRRMYAGANMLKGPGDRNIAPQNLLQIAFNPTVTVQERQAAMGLIGGEIIARHSVCPGGYYYVRIPGTGTMAGLTNAISRLKTVPQVASAIIGADRIELDSLPPASMLNANCPPGPFVMAPATVFDLGCTTFEITLSSSDGISVTPMADTSCGPVVPMIQGTPTYNRATGRAQLPVALRNEGTQVYKPPVWLIAWPDNVGPDDSPEIRAHRIPFRGFDRVQPHERIWTHDALLAPSSDLLPRLDPGTTSRSRIVELAVPSTGTTLATVITFRILLRGRAGRIDRAVPTTPPNSMPQAVRRAMYASGNMVKGPGDSAIAPHNLLAIEFKPTATRQEREAAVGLVGGEVVGGYGAGSGGYYVRIQGTGTMAGLTDAVQRLNAVPQVASATVGKIRGDSADLATRATVFDGGCTKFEIGLSGTDGITVAPVPQASCGPVVPLIQGTPMYDHRTGRIQLPIALKNEGTNLYTSPVWLVTWPDSVEPSVIFRGYDQKQPATVPLLPNALIWYADTSLDPGTTSRSRTVELLIPPTATSFRLQLRARAGRTDQPVAAPPAIVSVASPGPNPIPSPATEVLAEREKVCFTPFAEAPKLPAAALRATETVQSPTGGVMRLEAIGHLDFVLESGRPSPCRSLQLTLLLRPRTPGHRVSLLEQIDSVWIRRGVHQFALPVHRALDPEDTSAILIRPVEKQLRVVAGPIDVFLRLEARSRLWIAVHPMSLTCLQGSQLSLHGIGLGASSADVRRLVGTPAVEIDDSSDAGGVHHRAHLWYSNFLLDVDLDENHVTLLETTSPYVALPFDISVWATLQDVGRRLRLSDPAEYLRGDTLPLTSCGRSLDDRGMSGLDLIFEPVPPDATRRLRKIRVFERGG